MDCIGLGMSVSSYASCHLSPEKQSDDRTEFNHRFSLNSSKISSYSHKMTSNITDDEDELEKVNIRNDF